MIFSFLEFDDTFLISAAAQVDLATLNQYPVQACVTSALVLLHDYQCSVPPTAEKKQPLQPPNNIFRWHNRSSITCK